MFETGGGGGGVFWRRGHETTPATAGLRVPEEDINALGQHFGSTPRRLEEWVSRCDGVTGGEGW